MSSFEEGVIDWYEAQNVVEIENFDKDQYGNTWYNVKFTGDAGTFMWLAKNQPEEGKKYYGHLEPTKSGKALRFRTDKVPEDTPKPEGAHQPHKSPETEENIARAVALKAAVEANAGRDVPASEIPEWADAFLPWLKNEEPTTDDKPEQPEDTLYAKQKVNKVFGASDEPLPEYPGDEEQDDE